MAHLNQVELVSVADTFYTTLFGEALVSKWKALKSMHEFATEREFVEWLLTTVEMLDGAGGNHIKLNEDSLEFAAASNGYGADDDLRSVKSEGLDQEVDITYVTEDLEEIDSADMDSRNFLPASSSMPVPDTVVAKPEAHSNIFKSKRSLKKQQQQQQQRAHVCNICFLRVDNGRALAVHMLQVHQSGGGVSSGGPVGAEAAVVDTKMYTCSVCALVLASRTERINHEKLRHARELRLLTCDWCDKKFANRHSLQFHTRSVHLRVTQVSCGQCGKTFCHRAKLKRHHDEVHMQIKKFVCQVCDKRFAREEKLVTHHALSHNVT